MRTVGHEHIQSDRAMEAARAILGQDVSRATLARWAVKYAPLVDKLKPALNPALIDRSAIIAETQESVINSFIGIRDKAAYLLDNLENLKTATPQQQAIIMGIAQTHISAMTAIPADAMQVTQRLYRLCERLGENYITLVEDNISVLESQHAEYSTTIDIK